MKRIPFAIIFLTILAAIVSAQDESRAAATWQVQKYDINAALPQNAADRNITSKATLTLKNVSGSPATTLSLRISPAAEVSSISINGATADFSKREEKISANAALQRVVVRLPSVPPGGSVTAAVEYKIPVKENTGLAAISPVASQFLPLSYWYPTPNSWYFPRGADMPHSISRSPRPAVKPFFHPASQLAAALKKLLPASHFLSQERGIR